MSTDAPNSPNSPTSPRTTQSPDTTPPAWSERWSAALQPTYGTPPIELVGGRNATLEAEDGTTYIDLLSGIAVNALGHAHPAIVEAVSTQIAQLSHTSNLYAHPQVLATAEELLATLSEFPATSLQPRLGADDATLAEARVFFCNSGAEANEAAFKIARLTGRSRILAAERGFHGRTIGSLALTGQPDKRAPFEPLPSGVEFFPYNDLDALRSLADADTAAIILESIQGETGVIPATVEFLRGVRSLCDELGILMICDEVQAGMGRTGAWWGFHHAGVVPDVITMAKGLGGGLPMGACVALPAAQLLAAGKHGTTFGGNPVCCAAARAVMSTIRSEGLLDRAAELEERIRSTMGALPGVVEVRGRGLMLAIVLDQPVTVNPFDYGVLINLPEPHVIRLLPPLTTTDEELATGLDAITRLIADNRSAHDNTQES